MQEMNPDTLLEEKYLRKIIELAEKQLQQSKDVIEGKQEELIEAKRAVREDATHSVAGNLYSSDNFEALVELSQCMTPVQEILADCEEEKRKLFRLEKMLKKPYFARIDFRFEDGEEAERVYIGRSSLIEKETKERMVYDWRSPIASVFYLHLKRYGAGEYRSIRQVVIDEAQDYYPLQYEIFHLLFPNAKFTVLGDINQTLAKREDMSLYETVRKILDKKNASVITLNKSFRCTNEILEFGLKFIEHRPEIQSFNRAGDSTEIIVADTQAKLVNEIVREVNLCREKGFKTICLICKTEKNAVKLYEQLKEKMEIQLITDKNIERLEGIFIMPVYMSKGLEFDAVVICDVDAQNYYDEDDRKLLYVECTRALHRLSLICEGELSPLVTA